MANCLQCYSETNGRNLLCPSHSIIISDSWARVNSIMCDLLHRGINPRRLPINERWDKRDIEFLSH